MLMMPLRWSPPIRAAFGMALCLSVWPQVARAQLAVPAPIVPPSQGGLVPIQPNAPGGGLQPIQPQAPGGVVQSVQPTTPITGQTSIGASSVTAPAVMAQIEAGRLTPEKAWATGAVTVPDLIYILDSYVSEWGFISGADRVELRRAVAGLLVEHGAEVLTKPAALPAKARLWLSDYFMSIGDPHTVTMAESILGEVKVPVDREDPLVFETVERMGRYYGAKGEWSKGTETWLRMKGYYPPDSRFIPDALIETARLYWKAGDKQKAGESYIQAIDSDDESYAGGALLEYANALLRGSEQAQAQHLLEQVFKQPTTSRTMGSKHLVAAALLGRLHYLKGEWGIARGYYEQVIAQSRLLYPPQEYNGFADVVNSAEDMLRLIAQWQKQAIVCDPQEIHIVTGLDKKDEPITRRFLVRMSRDVALKVSSNDPRIKVHSEDSPWAEDAQPLQFEKEVVLEIAPEALQKDYKVLVTVSSLQLPGFQTQVPVQVEVQKP